MTNQESLTKNARFKRSSFQGAEPPQLHRFGRLKNWRRVATRYDRCPKAFFSATVLAAIIIYWL
nr:hypothetical protein [Pseudooceanicola algae]